MKKFLKTTNNKYLKLSLYLILFFVLIRFIFLPTLKWVLDRTIIRTKQPTSIVNSQPSPTTNWKTYNGEVYGFKYPSSWSVLGNETNLQIYDRYESDPTSLDFVASFYFSDSLRGVTLEDLVGKQREIADKVFEEKLSNIILGGKQAIKSKVLVSTGSQTNVVPGVVVKIQVGEKILYLGSYYDSESKITPPELDTIFDQILSTFKFTN